MSTGINREKAVRDAFYTALVGNLTYDSNQVPICDTVLDIDNNNWLYVLIGNQTATSKPNMSYHAWETLINIQIINKQITGVASDISDSISEQIEDLVISSMPSYNGLIQQTGWKIPRVKLETSTYIAYSSPDSPVDIVKQLTFKVLVTKQNS